YRAGDARRGRPLRYERDSEAGTRQEDRPYHQPGIWLTLHGSFCTTYNWWPADRECAAGYDGAAGGPSATGCGRGARAQAAAGNEDNKERPPAHAEGNL